MSVNMFGLYQVSTC